MPGVLIGGEAPAIQPSEWNVPFVDRRRQELVAAMRDRCEPPDWTLGGADDVAVVLGTRLAIDNAITCRSGNFVGGRLGLHETHD